MRPMKNIKYRTIRIEVDGVTHEVTLVFKKDSVTAIPVRFKAGEKSEEFPVKIIGAPEGDNSANFYYEVGECPRSLP